MGERDPSNSPRPCLLSSLGERPDHVTQDRPVHLRADDPVVRTIRRSRGYAPEPLPLAWAARRPVLGCGAELTSTFCLARGGHAVLSSPTGDRENDETLRSYTEGVTRLRTLFGITPEVIAHDIHPDYLSTAYATDWARRDERVELLAVQHHHAHVAACLADNGVAGPVIGLACDGLGFGTDGTLWGGEVLVASLATFRRLAHLEPVAMPGGAAAVREPWRMAAAYLRLGYGPEGRPRGARALVQRQGERWDMLAALLDAARLDPIAGLLDGPLPGAGASGGTLNAPLTSSAGRLFDAVAALVGLRDRVHYEGQAAVELEQCVDPDEDDWYPARQEGPLIRGCDLVRGVVDDLGAGVAVPVIAARFHNGLVEALARACVRARAETSLGVVALSGGVFQNVVLTGRLMTRLRADGFTVLTHRRVPCNNAGVSLGQVAVALARDLDPAGFAHPI